MTVQFDEAAERDLVDAIDYYNRQKGNLGAEFAAEVERTIGSIVAFPDAWPPLSKRTRRCQTQRFPFAVVYQLFGDTIFIVEIQHLQKLPRTQHWD